MLLRRELIVWCFFRSFKQPKQPSNMQDNITDDGESMVELTCYLNRIKDLVSEYPKWAKYDTKTTMSDNRGGVIKF